ncbi:hypothetical protein B9Q04_02075 [Candidatus Marsarchaeota G2 archaeon BE_D]|jgi:molybdopterin synthase sulfur carrier subunit|uniref:Molybdopterin synthase sulfur carrier subunit n=4 Tax=Candidatus Marsarchaeota group 2 TaxID=2203771 RepID=A0A2R6CEB0_9ARCH|nr:MAG: hypothetical protein B9Q06_08870 [Candidatus Marsarchaeota G2 archaeon ECH_B_2]PSN98969.1 MAG: hypothetical protein B9Q07_08130 [Candidatus Marsarchaeota G2 archaeon ECH_B_3]PSO01028.1 MAG: hypothetical protein B9Q05_09420 [Candidatus Marsarchaeota G2 archaeon ECH_B_1]PSO09116.1 MAG: hypothetical protein B9Q04_02075 [Candidatus Marsarchaeota G2 archaeon BE_D]
MKVTVRYFARLREMLGKSSDEFELEDSSTIMDLLNLLSTRYPNLKSAVFENDGKTLKKIYQVLVSGQHVSEPNRKLHDGDIVAILPPVAGG